MATDANPADGRSAPADGRLMNHIGGTAIGAGLVTNCYRYVCTKDRRKPLFRLPNQLPLVYGLPRTTEEVLHRLDCGKTTAEPESVHPHRHTAVCPWEQQQEGGERRSKNPGLQPA